ncbi:uncharacterized protein LACBIDRAFT_335655 [Laccaria bicolor S238N-H82]|uniref:Predicted protein n=1 Tax=Laccaria bicolor (strain S238N-H82 / ATCC MYA-4686) TaxID=486041 RepID=B0E2Z0_LACBS|nr:uncharacterized protein LACBIDRAFT_335655 [Laccaria bicolor S238N-H82]EDQ98790.1 predicted protein [Laccaria bicolor S238N-H82]|eukprot:XP_001890557.1 predicted protein [Laccaria bicolor S238N-H82]
MAHLASIHPCMQSLRKEPPPPLPKVILQNFPSASIPHSTSKASSSALTASPPTSNLHPYPRTNFPRCVGQPKLCLVTSTSSLHNVFDAGWAQAAAEGDQFPMEKCQGFCGTECVKGGWDSKRDFKHNFCSTQHAHYESPAVCASQAQSQTADANDHVEHFCQLNLCPCIAPFSTISEHDLYCHYVPGLVGNLITFILNFSSAELRFWLVLRGVSALAENQGIIFCTKLGMRQRSTDMATTAWCGMLGAPVRTLLAPSSAQVCGDFDLAPFTTRHTLPSQNFALGPNGRCESGGRM